MNENFYLISHRGNLTGSNKDLENNPSYIEKAINLGFDVEVDVYFKKNQLFLGHDEPIFRIDVSFLKNKKIWCHAKNIESLDYLLNFNDIHVFWHQNDDFTLTSRGYIWTYPGKYVTNKSILVLDKNISKQNLPVCMGICSDYVSYLI